MLAKVGFNPFSFLIHIRLSLHLKMLHTKHIAFWQKFRFLFRILLPFKFFLAVIQLKLLTMLDCISSQTERIQSKFEAVLHSLCCITLHATLYLSRLLTFTCKDCLVRMCTGVANLAVCESYMNKVGYISPFMLFERQQDCAEVNCVYSIIPILSTVWNSTTGHWPSLLLEFPTPGMGVFPSSLYSRTDCKCHCNRVHLYGFQIMFIAMSMQKQLQRQRRCYWKIACLLFHRLAMSKAGDGACLQVSLQRLIHLYCGDLYNRAS